MRPGCRTWSATRKIPTVGLTKGGVELVFLYEGELAISNVAAIGLRGVVGHLEDEGLLHDDVVRHHSDIVSLHGSRVIHSDIVRLHGDVVGLHGVGGLYCVFS